MPTSPSSSADRAHPLRPLGLREVTIDDEFWTPRRDAVRDRTLPQQEHQLRTHGQLDALRLTWRPGDANEPHIFWESDVAKWIEAAASLLAVAPDPVLEASVDEVIALLASAQQPDGYLNTYFTVVKPGQRFTDLHDAHELYCLGHLIEAAVAHHDATGKTTLLDVVRRYADLVDRELGPGGSCEGGYDGHQEIELALVKLARATNEPRYLALASRILDARGTQPAYFAAERERRGGARGYFGAFEEHQSLSPRKLAEYNQSHAPVREQDEAVGHAVRLTYQAIAMADIAAETGDAALLAACERLWRSAVRTKMYVTGALGTDPSIEGFSAPFDLPNATGYGETCAAIGLVMWAQRLANLHRDGQYGDVMERALFNGVLAGASADGTRYFYGNPLASAGGVARREWFSVACCPPNLARLVASLQTYAYGENDDEIAVHLYVAGTARTRAGGGATLTVESRYPADGTVRVLVTPDVAGSEFTLSLRVPAWSATTTVAVNGTLAPVEPLTDRGYVTLRRQWQPGDVVTLTLGLDPVRVYADPRVIEDVGKVALQRGPVVYCLEGVDHDVAVHTIAIPRDAELATSGRCAISGLPLITAPASAAGPPREDTGLYGADAPARVPTTARAVPYFAWANRGDSDMTVWIHDGCPTTTERAR